MIRIEIFYLLFGLAVGFFIIYVMSPPPKVVLKYPNLANISDTTYVDENGICYKYFATEVPCEVNNEFIVLDKSN
jgi:hypothetical protein